jgi:hypothetical protein
LCPTWTAAGGGRFYDAEMSSSRRALPLLVLALVLAGCGKQERGAVAGPVGATESTPTAPVSLPSLTTPAAPVCASTKGWTSADVGEWAQDLIRTDAPNKITFRSDSVADDLCQAVKIQVEFWRVDFKTFTQTTYEMTSVLRKQVSLDGKKEVTVAAPKGFARGACRGTILAAYPGKPMSDTELPDSISASGYSGKSEHFFLKSDRVFYTFSSMPKISGSLLSKTGCEPKITLVPKK